MNYPIVVVASWRSGSTAYISHLSDKYRIPFYSEPFAPVDSKDDLTNHIKMLNKFVEQYNANERNYILKFMICDIDGLSPYRLILEKPCYLIRLLRKDLVAQIASHYIAKCTKTFHQYEYQVPETKTIPIDMTLLKDCFRVLTRNDWLLKHTDLPWNETVYYEDLGLIRNSMKYRITDKPKNYDEIRQAIQNMFWNGAPTQN